MRITELRKKVGKTDLYIEDLKIENGRIHGLVGPNGCGKSTLLKLIIGITAADSGSIDYEGIDPSDITLMSQRPYLMHTNVYENIVYPLKIRGETIDENKVNKLLERAGLWACCFNSGMACRLIEEHPCAAFISISNSSWVVHPRLMKREGLN